MRILFALFGDQLLVRHDIYIYIPYVAVKFVRLWSHFQRKSRLDHSKLKIIVCTPFLHFYSLKMIKKVSKRLLKYQTSVPLVTFCAFDGKTVKILTK